MSAPRRSGVGERRFAAASDGAEERAPTPTARRHGTGFLGCSRGSWPVWVCIPGNAITCSAAKRSRIPGKPIAHRSVDVRVPPFEERERISVARVCTRGVWAVAQGAGLKKERSHLPLPEPAPKRGGLEGRSEGCQGMGRPEKTRCARTSCVVSAADVPSELNLPFFGFRAHAWEVSVFGAVLVFRREAPFKVMRCAR